MDSQIKYTLKESRRVNSLDLEPAISWQEKNQYHNVEPEGLSQHFRHKPESEEKFNQRIAMLKEEQKKLQERKDKEKVQQAEGEKTEENQVVEAPEASQASSDSEEYEASKSQREDVYSTAKGMRLWPHADSSASSSEKKARQEEREENQAQKMFPTFQPTIKESNKHMLQASMAREDKEEGAQTGEDKADAGEDKADEDKADEKKQARTKQMHEAGEKNVMIEKANQKTSQSMTDW